jgi:Predicted nucleotide-binding protein containing TIR -like domain
MTQLSNYAGLWSGKLGGTNNGQFTIEIIQNGSHISGTAHINEPQLGSYVYSFSQEINEPLVITLLPGSKPKNIGLGVVTVSCQVDNSGQLLGKWGSSIGTNGHFTAQRVGHPSVADKQTEKKTNQPSIDSVFLVHGRDDGSKHAVARFLEQIGLKPIILNEQINRGKTVIEKFEAYAKRAHFAVILMTPDDSCLSEDSSASKHRARQNVLYELGYFTAALGRANTFVFKKGDIDIPSDIFGIVYEPYDEGGGWKARLAKELQAAGYQINFANI